MVMSLRRPRLFFGALRQSGVSLAKLNQLILSSRVVYRSRQLEAVYGQLMITTGAIHWLPPKLVPPIRAPVRQSGETAPAKGDSVGGEWLPGPSRSAWMSSGRIGRSTLSKGYVERDRANCRTGPSSGGFRQAVRPSLRVFAAVLFSLSFVGSSPALADDPATVICNSIGRSGYAENLVLATPEPSSFFKAREKILLACSTVISTWRSADLRTKLRSVSRWQSSKNVRALL